MVSDENKAKRMEPFEEERQSIETSPCSGLRWNITYVCRLSDEQYIKDIQG